MPQMIIYLEEKENDKVVHYSLKWDLSKAETTKKMIREFTESDLMKIKGEIL